MIVSIENRGMWEVSKVFLEKERDGHPWWGLTLEQQENRVERCDEGGFIWVLLPRAEAFGTVTSCR